MVDLNIKVYAFGNVQVRFITLFHYLYFITLTSLISTAIKEVQSVRGDLNGYILSLRGKDIHRELSTMMGTLITFNRCKARSHRACVGCGRD